VIVPANPNVNPANPTMIIPTPVPPPTTTTTTTTGTPNYTPLPAPGPGYNPALIYPASPYVNPANPTAIIPTPVPPPTTTTTIGGIPAPVTVPGAPMIIPAVPIPAGNGGAILPPIEKKGAMNTTGTSDITPTGAKVESDPKHPF
jgi:hypothetical protein